MEAKKAATTGDPSSKEQSNGKSQEVKNRKEDEAQAYTWHTYLLY